MSIFNSRKTKLLVLFISAIMFIAGGIVAPIAFSEGNPLEIKEKRTEAILPVYESESDTIKSGIVKIKNDNEFFTEIPSYESAALKPDSEHETQYLVQQPLITQVPLVTIVDSRNIGIGSSEIDPFLLSQLTIKLYAPSKGRNYEKAKTYASGERSDEDLYAFINPAHGDFAGYSNIEPIGILPSGSSGEYSNAGLPYEYNSDEAKEKIEEDRKKHGLSEGDDTSITIDLPEYMTRQEYDEERKKEEERLKAAEESAKKAIEDLIDPVAKEFLDINGDGKVDNADGIENYKYGDHGAIWSFTANWQYFDPKTYDLLEHLIVALAYGKTGEWYIGNIKVEVTLWDNGWGRTIKISDGKTTIEVFYDPVSIGPTAIYEVNKSFDNLKEKKDSIAGQMDDPLRGRIWGWHGSILIGNSRPTLFGADKKYWDVVSEYEKSSGIMSYYKNDLLKKETSPLEQILKISLSEELEAGAYYNSQLGAGFKYDRYTVSITFDNSHNYEQVSGEAADGDLLLNNDWTGAKETLFDVFNRILNEEPGAVVTIDNDVIEAIILLRAPSEANSDEDMLDESGGKA